MAVVMVRRPRFSFSLCGGCSVMDEKMNTTRNSLNSNGFTDGIFLSVI